MLDRWFPRTLRTAALALIVAFPSVARADAARAAAAEALFSEARRLTAENRHADACPKFEESQRLDPAIGTQFNLAVCYEKIGRTASAWAAFLEVSYAARASGQRDRERVAKQRADALEANLARALISTGGRALQEGARVARDGLEIGPAQLNVPVPVDPGDHAIELSAPGFKTWKGTFRAVPSSTVTVAIPTELESEPATIAPPAPAPVAVEQTPKSAPVLPVALEQPPDSDVPGRSQRAIGWTVGAVGVAGLVVGSFYGLKARSTNDDSLGYCREKNLCQPEGVALRDDARSYGNVSTVAFAIGGAAIASGLVLILTAPSSKAAPKTAVRSVASWNQGPSLALEGTW